MIAQHRWLSAVRFGLGLLALGLSSAGMPGGTRADLDQYLKKPRFRVCLQPDEQSPVTTRAGVVTSIKLTSQVWQGITWSRDREGVRAFA